MTLRMSRIHYPVTALGPGRRVGIWTQGCSFGCPGCVSRDTWSPAAGSAHDVREIGSWLADLCGSGDSVDGVTVSGGEPTEQPDALHALMSEIMTLRQVGVFAGDVLCYTGCELTEFLVRCPWAPDVIDAVITGRFRIESPTDLVWRGSANQRLVPLTDRGNRVYADHIDRTTQNPEIQLSVSDGQVWMIGIPRRGDLRQLEIALRADGVYLEDASWRP